MERQKEWRRAEIAKKICICQKKVVPLQPKTKYKCLWRLKLSLTRGTIESTRERIKSSFERVLLSWALGDNSASDTSEFNNRLLAEDWTRDVLKEWGVTLPETIDYERVSADEVRAIVELGFKCKQNPEANDFAECRFAKSCFDPDGKEHKCCLCKAQGGFFGVSKCIVPCVMYNSNKQGELIWNRYGFAI